MMNKVRKSLEDRETCGASRILVMKLLPALLEKNIAEFGEALTMLQVEVGKMFVEAQGGVFRHPTIQQGIEFLSQNGAYGSGQSSWGPAFYGLVEGKLKAKELSDKLSVFLEEHGGGSVFFSNVNNSEAEILTFK